MTKTEAELLAGWWEAWWAADFSWAGLAGKPLGSSDDDAPLGLRGETNLQAYWRRDPLTGLTRDDAEMRAAG
nr:hypothetical protein [Rubritepida sp.]